MKKLAFLTIFLIFAGSGILWADGGFYVGLKVGMQNQSVDRAAENNDPVYNSAGTLRLDTGRFDFGNYKSTGFAGGFVIGYDFKPRLDIPIRLDLDFTFRSYKGVNRTFDQTVTVQNLQTNTSVSQDFHVVENSNNSVHTIMANLYYDFDIGTQFEPFVGIGFGLAIMHGTLENSSINTAAGDFNVDIGGQDVHYGSVNMAYSLAGGVAYNFNEDWTVELGYKFIKSGSSLLDRYDLPIEPDVDSVIHDILLGIRYTF
jgi:opacity protein-like surface antigen